MPPTTPQGDGWVRKGSRRGNTPEADLQQIEPAGGPISNRDDDKQATTVAEATSSPNMATILWKSNEEGNLSVADDKS